MPEQDFFNYFPVGAQLHPVADLSRRSLWRRWKASSSEAAMLIIHLLATSAIFARALFPFSVLSESSVVSFFPIRGFVLNLRNIVLPYN